MKFASLLAGLVLAAPAAMAANANHPYSNIDHRNDAGNNTGDSQVEQLNQQQLSQPGTSPRLATNYAQRPLTGYARVQPGPPPAATYAGYPPPGYPAPVYAPPPYGYYPPPAYVVVPRPYYYPRPFYYPY